MAAAETRLVTSNTEELSIQHETLVGVSADRFSSAIDNVTADQTEGFTQQETMASRLTSARISGDIWWKTEFTRPTAALRAVTFPAGSKLRSDRAALRAELTAVQEVDAKWAASSPHRYEEYVRVATSVDSEASVAAAQSKIDAGGQIALWYLTIGVTDVASHAYNDSLALSLKVGDIMNSPAL